MNELYYSRDGVEIYLGDSREIIVGLGYEFDVICTDPPYGMNYSAHRKYHHWGHIHGDDEFPMWLFDVGYRRSMFVFCRWTELMDFPRKPDSVIAWDKLHFAGKGNTYREYARRWECIAFYSGESHVFVNGRPSDVIGVKRVDGLKKLHSTQKPVEVVQKLLYHVKRDSSVLDPFMGSGTTLFAAKQLGMSGKIVGIEIEERYCEVAARRLDQGVLFT